MEELNQFAEELIAFEKQKHLTDNDVAFGSQLSVERIHNIKSTSSKPTDEEVRILTKFMRTYKN